MSSTLLRVVRGLESSTATRGVVPASEKLATASGSLRRWYSRPKKKEKEEEEGLVVMGVESSCDDTGVAVMTQNGRLLGNCLRSQTDVHIT